MSLSPGEGMGSEMDQGVAGWSLSPSGEQERRLRRVSRGLGLLGESPQEGSEVTGKVGGGLKQMEQARDGPGEGGLAAGSPSGLRTWGGRTDGGGGIA